ncbi:hypothetical protein Hanom_Chr02g00151251 [Helianthus anomalus]
MRGGPSNQAGPSHHRTPSASFDSYPYEDWRHSIEPVRLPVSLSTSPLYHHSFGPQHSHESYHSQHSHHSQSQGHFDPNDYINSSASHKQLDPGEHHHKGYQDMDVDEDPDPVMPLSGTPTHPIDISSGFASYAGSPYQGPDEWAEWWGRYKWEFTPSYHNTPPPPEEPYLQAVTPPPPPMEEQPPLPPRRRWNARMLVRGWPCISSPQSSHNYPIFQRIPNWEDPQMRHR